MGIQDRIDEYRKRANDARREAERTQSDSIKKGYLDLAKGWDEMAERIIADKVQDPK